MLEPAAAERAARQPGERRAAAGAALRAAARGWARRPRPGTSSRTCGRTGTSTRPCWTSPATRCSPRPCSGCGTDRGCTAAAGSRCTPTLRQAAAEHERLVDLVLGGEPGAAAEAMARHIGHVRAEWSPDAG